LFWGVWGGGGGVVGIFMVYATKHIDIFFALLKCW